MADHPQFSNRAQVRTFSYRRHSKVTMEAKKWHLENPLDCPLVYAVGIIGGKWKPIIIHMLLTGARRTGQLRKAMPAISQKVLTQQLRELEEDGVVSRTVFAEVPPKVEYDLTDSGMRMAQAIEALYTWGDAHRRSQPGDEYRPDAGRVVESVGL
jgi:DNA-binding HxlR family transcriptional regulator